MPRLSSSLWHGKAPVTAVGLLAALLFSCYPCNRSAMAHESAKRLTNQDIISMTSLGLSDDVIIAKIRSATGADASRFDTSVDGLKALKAANVSDAVIKVMINPTPPPPPVVTTAAPMTL